MKFSILTCFCLVIALNVELGKAVDSILEKFEKELDGMDHKRSLKDATKNMKDLDDMKAFMDKLEADMKKKHDDNKRNIKKRDMSSFKDDMDKLEAEMAEAATKKAKKTVNQPLDELLDELNFGSKRDENENKYFQDSFYKIIGYKKRESTADEEASFKRMMLKDSLATVLRDLTGERYHKKEVNDDSTCKDTRNDCNRLKSYCKLYREKLKDSCALTCKYCRPCKDVWSKSLCESNRHQCENPKFMDRMRDNCYKTCKYCRAPAPPKCSKTTHGCCWDKQTIKLNSAGTNCPACEDKYRYVCKTFALDCMSQFLPGDFMRIHCPKQCKLCNGLCADNPKYRTYCGFWKEQLGWCEDPQQKNNMRFFCPKTCEFC